jgi:hypothetical protein
VINNAARRKRNGDMHKFRVHLGASRRGYRSRNRLARSSRCRRNGKITLNGGRLTLFDITGETPPLSEFDIRQVRVTCVRVRRVVSARDCGEPPSAELTGTHTHT